MPGTGGSRGRVPETVTPPAPSWGAAGESRGRGASATDTGPVVYSRNVDVLRGQVLARCGTARIAGEQGLLRPLVGDLYRSGIRPGDAADALILGDCGTLSEVVSELVAQGGRPVAVPVAERARLVAGPGTQSIIETAVTQGLERNALARQMAAGPRQSAGYAMAYFPSRAASPILETSDTANALYTQATAGYGLYTFVVAGVGGDQQPSLPELLRVIDTYVLSPDGSDRPGAETHVFLVAVDPSRAGQPLGEQVDEAVNAVTAPMRRDLGLYLVGVGEMALAQRLAERPGPFLVSGPQASLVPVDGRSPRLLVDLSDLGAEYMYPVVDAFDRPVPPGPGNGQNALDAVRTRLLSLFGEGAAAAGPGDAWVFRVGGSGARGTTPGARPGGGGEREGEPAAPAPVIEYQRPRIREAGLGSGEAGQA